MEPSCFFAGIDNALTESVFFGQKKVFLFNVNWADWLSLLNVVSSIFCFLLLFLVSHDGSRFFLLYNDLKKSFCKSLYKRKKREPSFDTNNNNKKQKIDDTTFNKDNQSAPLTLNKNTFFCPKKTDSVSALSIPAKKQEGSILSPIRYFGKNSLETCALLIEQYWPRDSNGNLLKVKQFIDRLIKRRFPNF